jgi:hypothetical protein
MPAICTAQYLVDSTKTVKIVASFEDAAVAGTAETSVDATWNPAMGLFSPHYWIWASPSHSYPTPSISPAHAWWGKTNASWENPYGTDNVNWWHTLGSVNGSSGFSDNDYRLFLPNPNPIQYPSYSPNYQDWRGYDKLVLKWSGYNPNHSSVNLQVFARTYDPAYSNPFYSTFYATRVSGATNTEQISLSSVPDAAKSKIGDLKFRVFNTNIASGTDYLNNYQRTLLYSAKLEKANPSPASYVQGGRTWTSKFLGSVLHRRYGSYSATGMYDEAKFKIWFGSGIPERGSSDNIYYIESSTLDPGADVAAAVKPVRITMAGGNLCPAQGPYGYGGDPSVMRMNGEWMRVQGTLRQYTGYVMYFSGLQDRSGNGCTSFTANQVYRAISSDGKAWTVDPPSPVVAVTNWQGSGFYGLGVPSVTYRNGTYYLYYSGDRESTPNSTTPVQGHFLRTSTDGQSFGPYTKTAWGTEYSPTNISTFNLNTNVDIKYVASKGIWVATFDMGGTFAEPSEPPMATCPSTIGATPEGTWLGVYTAYSTDGLNWRASPFRLAQDKAMCINHNPGLIGDRLGQGFAEMYLTFGASQRKIDGYEYYVRQLEYSSLKID